MSSTIPPPNSEALELATMIAGRIEQARRQADSDIATYKRERYARAMREIKDWARWLDVVEGDGGDG